MSYDNNNEGAIWKNEEKQKETHPDFKGNAVIEGVEYWVSAWKRSPDANPKAPALKFKVTTKEEVHKNGKKRTEQSLQSNGQNANQFDQDGFDDIPF